MYKCVSIITIIDRKADRRWDKDKKHICLLFALFYSVLIYTCTNNFHFPINYKGTILREHDNRFCLCCWTFLYTLYIFPLPPLYFSRKNGDIIIRSDYRQFPDSTPPFNYSRQSKSRKVRLLPGENVFIRVNAAPRRERNEHGVTLINIYPLTTSRCRDALTLGVCQTFETMRRIRKRETKTFNKAKSWENPIIFLIFISYIK